MIKHSISIEPVSQPALPAIKEQPTEEDPIVIEDDSPKKEDGNK